MVAEKKGEARFVEENYGASPLAKRLGVKRYPAVFVDDVLVATPKDFGFYGPGEGGGTGRYAPIRNAASQERFRADLSRALDLLLAGKKDTARAEAAPAPDAEIAAYPAVTFTTLDGKRIARRDLAGRVVLVELWATWCPPCRGTLAWLGEVKKQYGDRLTVATIALDSDAADVRQVAAASGAPFLWTLGTPALVRAFGDVSVLPTLLLFDRNGHTAAAFYGAPPDLHTQANAKIAALLR